MQQYHNQIKHLPPHWWMLFSKGLGLGLERSSYLWRLSNVSSMLLPSHFCVSSFNRDSCLQIQRRCLRWLSDPLPPPRSSFRSSWALFYSKLQQSSGSCYIMVLPLDQQGRWKFLFSSAPALAPPDPSRQFFVEVDNSDIGVSAVHSQWDSKDQKLHPCAFFSQHLSPDEVSYDVGNHELLAVVLALQEWRPWLEASGQPFVVFTDHKNLTL